MNATPALAYYAAGLKTVTYALRFGMALEGILRNRNHYEHDAAIEYMLHLRRVSGFRTEAYADVLPFNICDGAAVSGPMPLERREAIRLGKLGKRRGSAESPSAAAAWPLLAGTSGLASRGQLNTRYRLPAATRELHHHTARTRPGPLRGPIRCPFLRTAQTNQVCHLPRPLPPQLRSRSHRYPRVELDLLLEHVRAEVTGDCLLGRRAVDGGQAQGERPDWRVSIAARWISPQELLQCALL